MKSSFSLPLIARCFTVISLLFSLCSQAHAGYWELEQKVWTGESHWKTVYHQQSPGKYNIQVETRDGKERDRSSLLGSSGNSNSAGWPDTAYINQNANGYSEIGVKHSSTDPIPVLAIAHATVYAILKWHRNTINDPNSYQTIDDPDDNPPPFLYIHEKVELDARKFVRQSGGTISTYDGPIETTPHWLGNYYDIQGSVKSGAGGNPTPDSDNTSVNPEGWRIILADNNWQYSRVYDITGASYNLNNHQQLDVIRKIATPSDKIKLGGDRIKIRSLTFDGQVLMKDGYQNDGTGGEGAVNFGYDIEPLSFSLTAVSARGDDVSTLSNGNGSMLAGSKDTDNLDHKVDLKISIHGNNNQPISGFPRALLPKIEIEGDFKKDVGISDDELPAGVSNVSVNGYIFAKRIRSGDLLSTYIRAAIKETIGDSASISQGWVPVQLKMGENGETDWEPNFETASGDYIRKIWAKCSYYDEVDPSLLHNMEFVPSYMEARELDATTGEVITKIFSVNPNDAQNTNSPNTIVVIKDDITPDVFRYLKIDPTVESNNRVYKSKLNLKSDVDFVVDKYAISLRDNSVWQKK